jgi:hypothetical protein
MCEYCEQKDKWGCGKEIMSEVCIINGEKLSVVTFGYEQCVDINYCPMCGRKLGVSTLFGMQIEEVDEPIVSMSYGFEEMTWGITMPSIFEAGYTSFIDATGKVRKGQV